MRTLALALILLVAAPAAAHTSVFSSDGKYRVVFGQLEEPVVTYQKSGLDLCFQMNTTARTPVANVNPGALSATLVAPGGERHSQELRSQFGRPGCFTFVDPYVPTVAGQYTVDLGGDLNGSVLQFTGVPAGGAVDDASAVSFPTRLATNAELDAAKAAKADLASAQMELAALQARVATLEARIEESRGAPAVPLVLVLVAVAFLALRRR